MPLKEGVSRVLPLHTTWPEPDTQTQPYAQDLSKNTGYLLLQIIGSYLNYLLKVLIVFWVCKLLSLPSFIHSLETEGWIQHTKFLQIKKKKESNVCTSLVLLRCLALTVKTEQRAILLRQNWGYLGKGLAICDKRTMLKHKQVRRTKWRAVSNKFVWGEWDFKVVASSRWLKPRAA